MKTNVRFEEFGRKCKKYIFSRFLENRVCERISTVKIREGRPVYVYNIYKIPLVKSRCEIILKNTKRLQTITALLLFALARQTRKEKAEKRGRPPEKQNLLGHSESNTRLFERGGGWAVWPSFWARERRLRPQLGLSRFRGQVLGGPSLGKHTAKWV